MPLPAFLAAALPALGTAAVNVIGNLIGGRQQYKQGIKLARFAADYNSPKNQRSRYMEAGMNPNLAYGQGSPGSMDTPRGMDAQMIWADLGTKVQQARYLSAQADLTNTKVDESGVKQDLMRAQKSLVDANPYLVPGHVESIVSNMESVARLKKQESDFMLSGQQSTGATTQGQAKMMLQINRIAQQFELGEQDKEIKAKIIQSKEFQNALQQIQVEWMRDKEITPQHIYLGIMMLLQKMM